MRSPLHPDRVLERAEIEPGLYAYRCPESGGVWIPLESYLNWRSRQPVPAPSPANDAAIIEDDSGRRALVCPESGRLLLRFRVGHDLGFHIDRSPATGGVWLDNGEWEALKSKGLHSEMHLVFTASYQRALRSAEYARTMEQTFRNRIGAQDFPKVVEFGAWLSNHPRRRDICSYLLNELDKREGPSVGEASTGA